MNWEILFFKLIKFVFIIFYSIVWNVVKKFCLFRIYVEREVKKSMEFMYIYIKL